MIEKSPLASDAESSRSELLECRDLPHHGMFRRRKPDQPVHMIRHDEEQTAPPSAAFLPVSDNIKQRGCAIAADQIIRPAATRADRDEEGRFLRRDAERSFMRQAFSLPIVHCPKMSGSGRLGPADPTKQTFPAVGAAVPSRPLHESQETFTRLRRSKGEAERASKPSAAT